VRVRGVAAGRELPPPARTGHGAPGRLSRLSRQPWLARLAGLARGGLARMPRLPRMPGLLAGPVRRLTAGHGR
ncbi:hypothetical protein AAHZ94_34925, partial [Streptomyces sp. HSW2009]|uniref:hypothetical protein n=1 Tax=Streptomyces sp. HSW2009 TaxID=3142890 RepID=UPI0032ECB859